MVTKVWHYEVTGRGQFPFDMLRYDRCWPTHESEAGKLADHYGTVRGTFQITGYSEPTVGRWQSFGWTVINVRKGL